MKFTGRRGEGLASETGFSLAELLVVLTMILIVAGMSMPSLSRTIENTRLRGATQKLASAFQDARIRATQDNTSYEVILSAPGISPSQACLDLDDDGACDKGEPVTLLPSEVKLTNLGVPAPLDASALGFSPVSLENSFMRNQQNLLVPGLAWNALGLPCQKSSPASPCTPVGWVQYLQFQRPGGDIAYSAVTVSPTGRIRTWMYIPSGNGNGSWL